MQDRTILSLASEAHVNLTVPGDGSNAGVNESNINVTVVEPAPAAEVEVPAVEEPDSFRTVRDELDAEYAEALATDIVAEATAEANRVTAAAASC